MIIILYFKKLMIMKNLIQTLLFLNILLSCTPRDNYKSNIKYEKTVSEDTNIYNIKEQSTKLNTQINDIKDSSNYVIINYYIDGLCSEGAEAKAYYKNKKIKKIYLFIACSGGQEQIIYKFDMIKNLIEVNDKKYLYKTQIDSIKSSNDIYLNEERNYIITFDNKIIGDVKSEDVLNIFKTIKANIPFEIK